MKAITVRQPWASLIVAGVKTIETRPAPPNGGMRPNGVRGLPGLPIEAGERIAIHASTAKPKIWWEPSWSYVEAHHRPPEGHWLNLPGADAFDDGYESADGDWWHHAFGGPLGAIVGEVIVSAALPVQMIPADWDQLPLGEFEQGRWGWMLADPTLCTPRPMKGRQGVWEVPA